jgi:hypothetical protein
LKKVAKLSPAFSEYTFNETACLLAAFGFVVMQDHQAIALSNSMRH